MDAAELKQEIIRQAAAKGWTNQELADRSGVPLSTIAAIRSKSNTRVPSVENAMRIMDALAEGEPGRTIMQDSAGSEPEVNVSQALIDLYERVIKHKNRWIRVLFTAFCLVVVFVFAVLIYDITHRTVGWITY